MELLGFDSLTCYYILLQVVQRAAFYCWRNYMSPYKDKRWRSKRDTALRRDKFYHSVYHQADEVLKNEHTCGYYGVISKSVEILII